MGRWRRGFVVGMVVAFGFLGACAVRVRKDRMVVASGAAYGGLVGTGAELPITAEARVHVGGERIDFGKGSLVLLPWIVPTWSTGLGLGWTFTALTRDGFSRRDLFHVEWQATWRGLEGGLGWRVDPATGTHGPHAKLRFSALYLRTSAKPGDPRLELGLAVVGWGLLEL